MLYNDLKAIPKESCVLVYDETGKGTPSFTNTQEYGRRGCLQYFRWFISLQRQAYAVGFQNIHVNLPELENKRSMKVKVKKLPII